LIDFKILSGNVMNAKNFDTAKMQMKILLFVVIILLAFGQSKAQKNEDCLACHEDQAMTMTKNGKDVKIGVKKVALMKSVHGKVNCIQCHVGFNPDDVPHKAKIEPVNCMNCHKEPNKLHVFHPQMIKAQGNGGSQDVNCKGCHGTHTVESTKSQGSKFYFTKLTDACGNCHKEKKAEHLQSQHYFELSHNNPNVPTCMFCHKNPITDGTKLDEAKLKVNQEKLCLKCHIKDSPNQSNYAKSLVNYEKSVHGAAILRGKKEAATCVDCHGSHDLRKKDDPQSRINQLNVPNVCGKCHVGISQEYKSSIHGHALIKGNKDAPVCTYCHGEHAIKSMPELPQKVFEENHIDRMAVESNKMVFCVGCHSDAALAKRNNILTIEQAHNWLPNKAKHWDAVKCVDCHSSYNAPNLSHDILSPAKTIKKCEECHNQNSVLLSQLYKHEKTKSRQKLGFINGTILSDAYVVGTTRNVILDSLSIMIFGLVIAGIGMHGFLRWYFKREKKVK
jgi:hypothetical protein